MLIRFINQSAAKSYLFFSLLNSLDATDSIQLGRYANDAAPGDTQRNAVMKCLSNKGRPHLALFAMRKIAAEEEIRYDYGVSNLPWRNIKVCISSI